MDGRRAEKAEKAAADSKLLLDAVTAASAAVLEALSPAF